MITIINKTPADVIAAFRANKPKNNTTVLFLVKNQVDIPMFGVRTAGDAIFAIKQDRTEVSVDNPDRIELRT